MLNTPAPCKVTIEFNEMTGTALPDGQCEEFVNALVRDAHQENVSLTVGTEMLIMYIRLAVAEERLSYLNVEIIFNGQVLKLTPTGNLVGNWPNGFCDRWMKIVQKLTHRRHQTK